MYKNTLLPKVERKFGTSRSDKLPPVTFENGSFVMSFNTKDISAINKKNQGEHHNSTVLDSSILNGLNRSGDKHPNYKSATFGDSIVDVRRSYNDNNDDYLTPLDFIQIIRTDPDMRDEFCYMLKKSNPYDWQIVDFSQKEKAFGLGKKQVISLPKEYMTISSRGMVHTIEGEETFVTLDDWVIEYEKFNKLKDIKFFKHYKLWKNFMLWRKLRRRTNFKKKKIFLQNNLFLIDEKLGRPLLEIREVCYEIINNDDYVKTATSTPKNIEPFEEGMNSNQIQQSEWVNQVVNGRIKKLLSDSCKLSLNHFKELNKIKNRDGDGVKPNEEKPINLNNDTGKEMPYTQEATIRIHYKRLKKFIRLVDYLVLESKIGMVNNSLIKLSKSLQAAEHILDIKARNNGGLIPSMIVRPEFTDIEILYNPSLDRILRCFDGTMSRGVHYISDQHNLLANAPEFSTYTKIGDNPEDIGIESIDLHGILNHHDVYGLYKDMILDRLNRLFNHVIINSEDMKEIFDIVVRCTKFNENMIEDRQGTHIVDMIEQFVDDDDSLKKIVEKIDVGVFSFERDELKNNILNYALDCLNIIEDHLPVILSRRSKSYIEKMKVIQNKLTRPIDDVDTFVDHLDVFVACKDEFETSLDEFSLIQDLAKVPYNDTYKLKFPDDCKQDVDDCRVHKETLKKIIDEIDERLDQETVKYKRILASLMPSLEKERREIEVSMDLLHVNDNTQDTILVCDELEPLKTQIDALVVRGELYQKFQLKLNMEITNIEDVIDFKKKLTCYHTYWNMKREWDTMLKLNHELVVKEIDREEYRKRIEINLKKTNGLLKELENNEAFKSYKEELEKNRSILVVLDGFSVSALSDSDWKEIKSYLINDKSISFMDFNYNDDSFFISEVTRMNMIKYKNEIYEISMRAAKVKELEKRLEEVKNFPGNMTLICDFYKGERDVHILGNNDEFIKKLDSSLVDVTNILSNKYVLTIKELVQEEQKRLLFFQRYIDELYFCQRMWMYLEPIYNSDENNKELAKEKKAFKNNVHKLFSKQTKDLAENFKHILSKAKRNETKIIEELEKIHKELEDLEKQLITYLEKKRNDFPRFYFISNDDLIEILSQAKDFDKIQSHFNKLFEAIKKIVLDHNQQVSGMLSPEGEIIIFDGTTSVSKSDPITNMMDSIEKAMKGTMKELTKKSFRELRDRPDQRGQWLMANHPAQSILISDSIQWTTMTESCLESDDVMGDLEELLDSIIIDLKDVIDKVRSNLSKEKRRMINSLITQDVHYRDIIEDLIEEEVQSKDDFKWLQQLRYSHQAGNVAYDMIVIRQVNSEIHYGFEYLGIPSKLAITTLTDRCWMTITTALSLNLGCSPQGPAGTGKTESVKDLAKNLGVWCVVYNCSEQVTVSMIGTQFLGVMHTGSWLCLDEFNRIDIEVLSVIAQQVLAMRHALSIIATCKETGDKQTIYFQDYTLGVDSLLNFKNLSIFTTMNPGYAGRTELPDNLKVLFRSVSMMVPDYALIAEILLFSEGFLNAKDLAVKLTKLYKLASEQLSQQKHYDFGMRAVKSILSMAGNLKRANIDTDEDLLLIEAMKDTNIPKFLDVDIKLFEGIVQDLFPRVVHEKKFNQAFLNELNSSILSIQLQPTEKFTEKCCQFDDIMKIRFGNMLLGTPMTGKSSILKVLRLTYNKLAENVTQEVYSTIDCMILNPKSITMGELFGETNPLSGDFTNGLASKIFTDYASREKREMKWIVFDGPVDSLWIENLNSVLDDSRLLCLSNGKRIKLREDMRVLFEVQDLAEASPATVSRIGMVFLDSDVIDPIPLLRSLLDTEFDSEISMPDSHKEGYISRADLFFHKILTYIRKHNGEPLKTINNNLVHSFVKILKTFYQLTDYKNRYVLEDEEEIKVQEQAIIGKIFVFASAWSLMSTMDVHNTSKIDQMVSNLYNVNDMPSGSIFDCYLDFTDKTNHWVKWESLLQEFEYNPSMKWSEILVPTINTKRFSYILRRAIQTKYPVYFSGITGTGKTVMCQNVIKEMSDQGLIIQLPFTFSAKTSSTQVQAQITSKMNILRIDKKTIYGFEKVHCLMPKSPDKTLVIHIDDINMPEVEQYGAQPPIELMRQLIDQEGFYDRQALQWREVQRTVVVATSVPPGNGRLPLTARFMRHFHILNIQASSDVIMNGIFGQIMKNFFGSFEFNQKVKEMDKNLVTGTLKLYGEMVTRMLPTPKKSHYTFNLRDVSKVFQGLVKMRPKQFQNSETVSKLWIHECTRVFSDRLSTHKDREFFAETLSSLSGSASGFNASKEDILTSKYLFGDFMNPTRDIEMMDNQAKLIKSISGYMVETPISIELFEDSIQHLCRLNRLLRQVSGHGLLIGVGGSGKKSLIAVASEMAGCLLSQIEPTRKYGIEEFRKEVFTKMLLPAGVEGKDVTLMLTDTHVVNESFLEDINNLINTGSIILNRELTEKLIKETEAEMTRQKITTGEDPISFFTKRVKDKLHIVLAMSPIGDSLRTRIRNFPSFVNCCNVDWLDPWPEEALQTVAEKSLDELFKEQNIDAEMARSLVLSCVKSHQVAIKAAEDFLAYRKRKVYITPKTYIDLIKSFKHILNELKGNIEENINKLSNGLSKLIESGEKVEVYKEEIARMRPILEEKNIKVQELIAILTVDKEIVDKQVTIVEKDRAVVRMKAEQIADIKREVEIEFEKAKPILQAAIKALSVLDRGSLAELKPKTATLDVQVKDIFECIHIFKKKPTDEKSIKATLADAGLIDMLKNIMPRELTKEMVIQVENKIKSNPRLNNDSLGKTNKALQPIFKWLTGLISAQESDELVSKMETRLKEVQVALDEQEKALASKEKELQAVVDKLTELENQYKSSLQEKTDLDNNLIKTNKMLANSGKLTQGLAEEHIRWQETVKVLEKSKVFIVADAFLSSACLAYHGPFDGLYRENLVQSWSQIIDSFKLKSSPEYALEESIGDITTIRKWNLYGLPTNKISVCNGIFVERSSSYPYMIDPQLQASKWIKKMESDTEQKINIVKANDNKNLSRILEASIANNIPCLIEDADEAINPYLDPLLLKNFTVKGKTKYLRIGEGDEMAIEDDFRLYFTTKISNPNFLPELFIRVSIINFTVTEDGLEEQLLAEVVREVMPAVEEKKVNLIIAIAKGKNDLRENENQILLQLKNSSGNILENDALIENLENSKQKSEEVKVTLEESEFSQKEILKARDQLRPVAIRGSLLYFIICDLADIDPMYQFSLSYITRLFVNTIRSIPKSDNIKDQCVIFVDKVTENIYLNVCRGLFNEHKKIFSFLVASKIQKRLSNIKPQEWDLFLKGIPLGAVYKTYKMPPTITLEDKILNRLYYFASFSDSMNTLVESMMKDTGLLTAVLDTWAFKSLNPMEVDMPRDIDNKISAFQKLLLVQILRPDTVLVSMIIYVNLTITTDRESTRQRIRRE